LIGKATGQSNGLLCYKAKKSALNQRSWVAVRYQTAVLLCRIAYQQSLSATR